MTLLITDLDNTLYDWVTFFTNAFKAMVEKLSERIDVEKEILYREFKIIHQKYRHTERPFTLFELPSVIEYFGELERKEMLEKLKDVHAVFQNARTKHLHPYKNVVETLKQLYEKGVTIVGFTEAYGINGYYRLRKLGIEKYFECLYAERGDYKGHPDPATSDYLKPPDKFIRYLENLEKPAPGILKKICEEQGFSPDNAIYLGDSLTKDIQMAKSAGITSVWAKYGTNYNRRLLKSLSKFTHWLDDDVDREAQITDIYTEIKPDFIIDSFEGIIDIINQKN